MSSIAIVLAGAGILTVVLVLHRDRRRQTALLRAAAEQLLLALVLREFGRDVPLVHISQRLLILGAQLTVVLLVLGFRQPPASPALVHGLCLGALLIATMQVALLPLVPVHPDGTVYLDTEVHGDVAGTLYYILYLSTPVLAIPIIAVGCLRAAVRRGQAIAARISLLMILLGIALAWFFLEISISAMLDPVGGSGIESKQRILPIALVLVLAGLAIGLVRRVCTRVISALMIRTTIALVRPVWELASGLHPDVVLPNRETGVLAVRMRFVRMIVETHDALTLIRGDHDPALEPVREAFPDDPFLSAALLMHLTGRTHVPSPSRWLLAVNRALMRTEDDVLIGSVHDLIAVRIALAGSLLWWPDAIQDKNRAFSAH